MAQGRGGQRALHQAGDGDRAGPVGISAGISRIGVAAQFRSTSASYDGTTASATATSADRHPWPRMLACGNRVHNPRSAALCRNTVALSAYGICLGLITIPVLSLLKPVIGFQGLVGVWAILGGVSLLTGIGYLVKRFHGYFLARARVIAPDARSWAAVGFYLALISALTLTPAIGLELLAPPCGMLAALIPPFQREQARWFGLEQPADRPWSKTPLVCPAPAASHDRPPK